MPSATVIALAATIATMSLHSPARAESRTDTWEDAARHARTFTIAPSVVSTGATPTAGISIGGTF